MEENDGSGVNMTILTRVSLMLSLLIVIGKEMNDIMIICTGRTQQMIRSNLNNVDAAITIIPG